MHIYKYKMYISMYYGNMGSDMACRVGDVCLLRLFWMPVFVAVIIARYVI